MNGGLQNAIASCNVPDFTQQADGSKQHIKQTFSSRSQCPPKYHLFRKCPGVVNKSGELTAIMKRRKASSLSKEHDESRYRRELQPWDDQAECLECFVPIACLGRVIARQRHSLSIDRAVLGSRVS